MRARLMQHVSLPSAHEVEVAHMYGKSTGHLAFSPRLLQQDQPSGNEMLHAAEGEAQTSGDIVKEDEWWYTFEAAAHPGREAYLNHRCKAAAPSLLSMS